MSRPASLHKSRYLFTFQFRFFYQDQGTHAHSKFFYRPLLQSYTFLPLRPSKPSLLPSHDLHRPRPRPLSMTNSLPLLPSHIYHCPRRPRHRHLTATPTPHPPPRCSLAPADPKPKPRPRSPVVRSRAPSLACGGARAQSRRRRVGVDLGLRVSCSAGARSWCLMRRMRRGFGRRR